MYVGTAFADYAKLSTELTLYHEDAGRGPLTVVLIPGCTISTAVFERQLEHFAYSDRYRVSPTIRAVSVVRARRSTATRISSKAGISLPSSII